MNNEQELVEVAASHSQQAGGATTQQQKHRKPYVLTKTRESWTPAEHERFLQALQLYERQGFDGNHSIWKAYTREYTLLHTLGG